MRRLRSVAIDQVTHNYYLDRITGTAWVQYIRELWLPVHNGTIVQCHEHVSTMIRLRREVRG